MKMTICILTATRAEYGLLKPLIQKLVDADRHSIKLIVTGSHLSPNFGFTYRQIEADGFKVDKKIEMLVEDDSASSVNQSMANLQVGLSEYFSACKPDLFIVLGDRYETLSAAITAMIHSIPICHLYGGETTEGAVDEAFRHAITKMSYLHFTSTESYKKRVIQLGESPGRVFNVGALGVENVLTQKLMLKTELTNSLGVDLDKPYAVVTYHPVTLESSEVTTQIKALLVVLANDKNRVYLITKANADVGGQSINALIDEYTSKYKHLHGFTSLGMIRYLSAVKYADFVIGNSSSGLIEVPSFGVPTINIGNRQKGRISAESVINCGYTKQEIISAIEKAKSDIFKEKAKHTQNPYAGKNTSDRIVEVVDYYLEANKIKLVKKFYDIEV